jgi:hypothetical protein
MNLINHTPMLKTFGNGFQITFPNKYTLIAKNGIGTKTTQTKTEDDIASVVMASRFGGNVSPDSEVEIYDPKKNNITEKFGEKDSLGFVSTIELINLMYIVSNLR